LNRCSIQSTIFEQEEDSSSFFSVLGDNHKLVSLTGWKQTADFEGLARILVEAELVKREP
jgi:hypothetical protein